MTFLMPTGHGSQVAATRPTVLMFHGNGGNHGHRIPLAKIFYGRMRCNVLMLSYRGYVFFFRVGSFLPTAPPL